MKNQLYHQRFALAVLRAITIAASLLLTSCLNSNSLKLTGSELKTIGSADKEGVMRVLTLFSGEDSLILRKTCLDFDGKDLDKMFTLSQSPCARLGTQMIATVTSPEQGGVGIAGPQVGLNRRIVVVQRFDKDGEPFEVYPNIRIIEKRGKLKKGPEGCLSIPGRRGVVERWDTLVIRYARKSESFNCKTGNAAAEGQMANITVTTTSQEASSKSVWEYVTETIGGFTAVIFQHECDHLDGILYPDRIDPQDMI